MHRIETYAEKYPDSILADQLKEYAIQAEWSTPLRLRLHYVIILYESAK
jgi:hypothetical protein